jgi:hypothetical protein
MPPGTVPHARPPSKEPWKAPPQVSRHLPYWRPWVSAHEPGALAVMADRQLPAALIVESRLAVSRSYLRQVPSILMQEEGACYGQWMLSTSVASDRHRYGVA